MSRKSKKAFKQKPAIASRSAECTVPLITTPASDNRRKALFVCIFLAALVWIVFGQTGGFEFVNYDDQENVSGNPHITAGMSWQGVVWAFTHSQVGRWAPLTAISRLLDCQLFGLWAGGHHLTNVLLHVAAVILLFVVLWQMTQAFWRSAFVAAIFAVHPLHVESVAWVSDRGDLLCELFFMLTLWAYKTYTVRRTYAWYLAVVILFALGLMTKPVMVTLPFVLLLLDYWPLGRFSSGLLRNTRALVVEKIPLFALSAASSLVAMLAQQKAFGDSGNFPVAYRIGNAAVSYVIYLWQMVWPVRLAPLYPRPVDNLPSWEVALAFALLGAVSFTAFLWRKKRPYFTVGWFWYLGMLVPASGTVQTFAFTHADRYTDLPQIGLALLATWLVADMAAGWRYRVEILSGTVAIVIVAMVFLSRAQTSHWQTSETLWRHALACTEGNGVAHNGLGNALLQKENFDEAILHYQKALEIKPDFPEAYINLGSAFFQKGNVDESIACYQKALALNPGHFQNAAAIKPRYAQAHVELGNALFQKGRFDEAADHYREALEITPGYAEASYNLGNVFLRKDSLDEAAALYQKALETKPGYLEAHNNLGFILLKKGRVDEAVVQYRKEIEIKPDYADAYYNIGIALLQKNRPDEALVWFQKALKIKPDYAEAHCSAARILAGKGRADEAVAHYRRGLQSADRQGNTALRGLIQSELSRYETTGSSPAGSP